MNVDEDGKVAYWPQSNCGRQCSALATARWHAPFNIQVGVVSRLKGCGNVQGTCCRHLPASRKIATHSMSRADSDRGLRARNADLARRMKAAALDDDAYTCVRSAAAQFRFALESSLAVMCATRCYDY